MPRLQRRPSRPLPEDLPPGLLDQFDPYANEVLIYGESFRWHEIESVEVALAPHPGPAGWLVRHVMYGEPRYHLGIYAGAREGVLPNVPLAVVRYVLETIAYYQPQPIPYSGPADIVPLIEA